MKTFESWLSSINTSPIAGTEGNSTTTLSPIPLPPQDIDDVQSSPTLVESHNAQSDDVREGPIVNTTHDIAPSPPAPTTITEEFQSQRQETENEIEVITTPSDTSLSQRQEIHEETQESPPSIPETATPCPQNPDSTMLNAPHLSVHPMCTRSWHGILKPNAKYALTTITSEKIPREPQNTKSALAHTGWKTTMEEELAALHQNQTWELVPRTSQMNVIGSKWVFKAKLKPDGSLDRLKARLVTKGYHQIDGVDYIETYSPVIKPGTIRMILTIALVKG